MDVMAIRDPADRVAEDLDRRFWDVFVVVRRARLPQVLQLPGLFLAGLDVQPWPDPGEAAQRAFGVSSLKTYIPHIRL
jgi:hypothetical protein